MTALLISRTACARISGLMVFDHVDKIKREYTDKYVVVDAVRPELARFQQQVGRVKTVNMSGRALVEFQNYLLNTGWYDIEIDYLKVVDKPQPSTTEVTEKKTKQSAPKASPVKKSGKGEKKLSPLEMARMQGASEKHPLVQKGSDKMTAEDVLALARERKPSQDSDQADAKISGLPGDPSVISGDTVAKARKDMSVADILAAARGKKTGVPVPSTVEPPTASAVTKPKGQSESSVAGGTLPADSVMEQVGAELVVASEETANASTANREEVDKSSMSVADMVAWCKKHDDA